MCIQNGYVIYCHRGIWDCTNLYSLELTTVTSTSKKAREMTRGLSLYCSVDQFPNWIIFLLITHSRLNLLCSDKLDRTMRPVSIHIQRAGQHFDLDDIVVRGWCFLIRSWLWWFGWKNNFINAAQQFNRRTGTSSDGAASASICMMIRLDVFVLGRNRLAYYRRMLLLLLLLGGGLLVQWSITRGWWWWCGYYCCCRRHSTGVATTRLGSRGNGACSAIQDTTQHAFRDIFFLAIDSHHPVWNKLMAVVVAIARWGWYIVWLTLGRNGFCLA